MDIASLIGILGAIGMIVFAMVSGGGVGPFIDVPSILIVFGGTFLHCLFGRPKTVSEVTPLFLPLSIYTFFLV